MAHASKPLFRERPRGAAASPPASVSESELVSVICTSCEQRERAPEDSLVTDVVAPDHGSPSGRRGPETAAPAAPIVSVIIPHFNDLENLRICVGLLKQQSLSADQIEIVVADNNSACGLSAVREACGGGVVVVDAPIQGAAAARNVAVTASHGVNLAFIDSDCRPDRDWLKNGLAAFSHADMVGGRVDVAVKDESHMTAVEAFERVFAFNNQRYVESERFSVTANMMVSRATFDRVGGFHADVSEDKEWGLRATRMGLRWRYEPNAKVSHPAREDWQALRTKWNRLTTEAYALVRQRRWGRAHWIAKSWAILLSPLFHTFTILHSRKLKRRRDKLRAILVLLRVRAWRFVDFHRVLLNDLFGHG